MGRLSVLAGSGQKNAEEKNDLIKDIERIGYNCKGKPEQLSGDLSGYWSVHIDKKNRIVFRIDGDTIELWQCGSHYRDK